MKLSFEQKSRVDQELGHTQELLSKEMAYREDLRHTDLVNFYTEHIAKLQGMLKADSEG